MSEDPDLQKFESDEDVVLHDVTVEQKGEDVVTNYVLSKFSFTINRPAAAVWKYMKDRNLWMEDLQFDRIVGDQPEGSVISFSIREKYHEQFRRQYGIDPKSFRKILIVRRVVPERVLVTEHLSDDGRKIDAYYMWVLHEHDGKTTVSGLMSFPPQWASKANVQQARATAQSWANEAEERWKKRYIPRLRQLVETNC